MSYKLGLSRDQYGFTKDHDVVDHFERMSDAVNANGDSLALLSGLSGISIDTDPTLAADSDTLVASQKATKEYVDTAVAPKLTFDTRVTTGGTRSETPAALAVGDSVYINYHMRSNAVGANLQVTLPSGGTYAYSILAAPVGTSDVATNGTPSGYTSNGEIAGGTTIITNSTNSGFARSFTGIITRIT